MHDVVGEIVLAVGDVDLGAHDGVAALTQRLRPTTELGQIRAGLRLGEVHGGGPLARDQLAEVARFQILRAVLVEGLDAAGREQRAEAEAQVGGVPHLVAGGAEQQRQALAAMIRIGAEAIPAASIQVW